MRTNKFRVIQVLGYQLEPSRGFTKQVKRLNPGEKTIGAQAGGLVGITQHHLRCYLKFRRSGVTSGAWNCVILKFSLAHTKHLLPGAELCFEEPRETRNIGFVRAGDVCGPGFSY